MPQLLISDRNHETWYGYVEETEVKKIEMTV
jgi:hypothetical protein